MASTFNSIAALVTDDTGTPEAPNGDGTQINSSFFAAVDAILNEMLTRSAKTVGGVWTWESPGSHTFQASSTSANELLVSNTNAGTSSIAQFRLGNNSIGDLARLYVTSSTASLVNKTILETKGNGLRLAATGSTGTIELLSAGSTLKLTLPGNTVDTLKLGTNTLISQNSGFNSVYNGILIASNITTMDTVVGSGFGTQGNTAVASWVADIGGSRGGDGAPWGSDQFALLRRPAAGTWDRALTLGMLGGFPNMTVGTSALSGGIGGVTIGQGTGTPVAGQILFGGNGSGWQLRIGRNNAGTISHYWIFDDTGHLRPNGHGVNNIGSTGGNSIGTIYAINAEFGGSINVSGAVTSTQCNPFTTGTGSLGTSSLKWGAIWALDSNFGDVSFDNQWSITEGEKVGLPHGLAFLRADQELCMFIDDQGSLYVNETQPLWKLRQSYRKMTKQERLSAS
jgi:hypothetical protein